MFSRKKLNQKWVTDQEYNQKIFQPQMRTVQQTKILIN